MESAPSVTTKAKAEYIIEDVAGCGRFQVMLYMGVVFWVKMITAYGIMFMAFGNYNPGWRCLDQATGLILTNRTGLMRTTKRNASAQTQKNHTKDEYVVGLCDAFRKCDDVEFNPDASTVVTEWGLVCDKTWIVSLIISIQMVGMLIGSYFGGQLSDLVGRRKTLCLNLIVCSVCQLISAFSISWHMLAALRFLIGIFTTGTLVMMFIYLSELMTQKWRAETISIPVWSAGATAMSFVAWLAKDWRTVEITGSCLTGLCLIPVVFWVPESLRWLEVKNKREEFVKVSKKILRLNKKEDDSLEEWRVEEERKTVEVKGKTYHILDLFRKGYRMITVCIVFLQFSFSLLYYAASFGAKSFHGNFYFNLFATNIIPVPIGLLAIHTLRKMSRRWYTVTYLAVTAGFSVISVATLLSGNEAAKAFGSTVLISVAKSTLDAGWAGAYAFNTELYPTVVRGVAVGVGSMSSRVGGIVAPFLIPKDQSVLYIFMIIMTGLAGVCCGVCLKLPETKGVVLKETFEDADTERAVEDNEKVCDIIC